MTRVLTVVLAVLALSIVGLTGCGGGQGNALVVTYRITAEYFATDGSWYFAPQYHEGPGYAGPLGDWRFEVIKAVVPAMGSVEAAGGTAPAGSCSVWAVDGDGSDGDPVLPTKGVWNLGRGDYHVIAEDMAGKWLMETRVHVTG